MYNVGTIATQIALAHRPGMQAIPTVSKRAARMGFRARDHRCAQQPSAQPDLLPSFVRPPPSLPRRRRRHSHLLTTLPPPSSDPHRPTTSPPHPSSHSPPSCPSPSSSSASTPQYLHHQTRPSASNPPRRDSQISPAASEAYLNALAPHHTKKRQSCKTHALSSSVRTNPLASSLSISALRFSSCSLMYSSVAVSTIISERPLPSMPGTMVVRRS